MGSRVDRIVDAIKHRLTLHFATRQNHLFTRFCRLPTQLEVLAGDVVDFLAPCDDSAEVRIIVFGCSIGAEPYSIASVLQRRRPDLRFRIECFDIEPVVVARGEAATYSTPELKSWPPLTSDFVESTFDRTNDGVIVRPEIRHTVRFAVGDVLDAALIHHLGTADVVVAQNFLYHLARSEAEEAFLNLLSLMKPRAALLVDGADLDMRTRMTAAARLRPCGTELERIHDESRITRGYAWPGVYWGLEPFDAGRKDAHRRFATIFFREGA